MITKKRIRRVLLYLVQLLRLGKTSFSKRDAKRMAAWIETIVDVYCPIEGDDKTFIMLVDGEEVRCRVTKMPRSISWVKGRNGIYYVSETMLKELKKKNP